MQGLGGVDRVAILLSECRTIEVMGGWVAHWVGRYGNTKNDNPSGKCRTLADP